MEFKIQKEIFETFPDFIAGVVFMKNGDNRGEAPEIGELLQEVEKKQMENFAGLETYSQHPQLAAWRLARCLLLKNRRS